MMLSPRTASHAVVSPPGAGSYLGVDGAVVPLTGEVVRLGSSPSADIAIDDATVSRRHALIVLRNGVAYLLDDGSRNGTWHNGARVQIAVLRHGDTIELGRARLSYLVEA
jgi:pSer/pThr/pTyr-binding forkhead associated (FHA) protein